MNINFFLAHLFSDYKNFENKTGILQRFINPYGSNNGLENFLKLADVDFRTYTSNMESSCLRLYKES